MADIKSQGQNAGQAPAVPLPTMDDVILGGLNQAAIGATHSTEMAANVIRMDPNAYMSPVVQSAKYAQNVTNAADAAKAIPVVAANAIQATLNVAETQADIFRSSDAVFNALASAEKALTQKQTDRDRHIEYTVSKALPGMEETIARSAQAAAVALNRATEQQEIIAKARALTEDPNKPFMQRLGGFFELQQSKEKEAEYNQKSVQFAQVVQQNQQLLSNAQTMIINREKLKVDPVEAQLKGDITFMKMQLEMNKDKALFVNQFGQSIAQISEMVSKGLHSIVDLENAALRAKQARLAIIQANLGIEGQKMDNQRSQMQLDEQLKGQAIWDDMAGVLGAKDGTQAKLIYTGLSDAAKPIANEILRQFTTGGQVELSRQLANLPADAAVSTLLEVNKFAPNFVPVQSLQDIQTKQTLTNQLLTAPDKKTKDMVYKLRAEAFREAPGDKKKEQQLFSDRLGAIAGARMTNSTEATNSLTSNYGFKNAKTITADTLAGMGMEPKEIAVVTSAAMSKDSPKGFVDELVVKLGNNQNTHNIVATYFQALTRKNNALGNPTVIGLPAQTSFPVQQELPFRSWLGGEGMESSDYDLATPLGVQSYIQARNFKLAPRPSSMGRNYNPITGQQVVPENQQDLGDPNLP